MFTLAVGRKGHPNQTEQNEHMARDLTLIPKARKYLARERAKGSEPSLRDLAQALRLIPPNANPAEINAARYKAGRIQKNADNTTEGSVEATAAEIKKHPHVYRLPLFQVKKRTDRKYGQRRPRMVFVDSRMFPIRRGDYRLIRFGFAQKLSFAQNLRTTFLVRTSDIPNVIGGRWCFVTFDRKLCIRRITMTLLSLDKFAKRYPGKQCYRPTDRSVVEKVGVQTALVGGTKATLFGTEYDERLKIHGIVLALCVPGIGLSLDKFTSRADPMFPLGERE